MKNIQKKWMIFLVATFVTFAGIGYTLIKNTNALEEEENYGIIDIQLSEGTIEFDVNIFEYTVTVKDFNNFEINPVVNELVSGFSIWREDRTEPKKIVVSIIDFYNKERVYTFNVIEDPNVLNDIDTSEDKNKDYTIIFIIIIIILVLLNVYRIIRNIKKKK